MDAQAHNQKILREKFAWVNTLHRSPEFKKFMEVVRDQHDEQMKIALDITTVDTMPARMAAAELKKVLDFVPTEHERLASEINT